MRTHIINIRIPFKVYLIILMLTLLIDGLFAQEIILNEEKHQSKALIEFAMQGKDSEIVRIGIIGENYNLIANLEKLINSQKAENEIQIMKFKSAEAAHECDLYFITNDHQLQLDEKIAAAAISKYHDTAYRTTFNNGKVSIKTNVIYKKAKASSS